MQAVKFINAKAAESRLTPMSDIKNRSTGTLQVCKNVTVSGRRTSIRMEPAMWEALHEICELENRSVHELCTMMDNRRGDNGLTASLRVFITHYFRKRAELRMPPPEPPPSPRPTGGMGDGPAAQQPIRRPRTLSPLMQKALGVFDPSDRD